VALEVGGSSPLGHPKKSVRSTSSTVGGDTTLKGSPPAGQRPWRDWRRPVQAHFCGTGMRFRAADVTLGAARPVCSAIIAMKMRRANG
jgi:hypothetical protein